MLEEKSRRPKGWGERVNSYLSLAPPFKWLLLLTGSSLSLAPPSYLSQEESFSQLPYFSTQVSYFRHSFHESLYLGLRISRLQPSINRVSESPPTFPGSITLLFSCALIPDILLLKHRPHPFVRIPPIPCGPGPGSRTCLPR